MDIAYCLYYNMVIGYALWYISRIAIMKILKHLFKFIESIKCSLNVNKWQHYMSIFWLLK